MLQISVGHVTLCLNNTQQFHCFQKLHKCLAYRETFVQIREWQGKPIVFSQSPAPGKPKVMFVHFLDRSQKLYCALYSLKVTQTTHSIEVQFCNTTTKWFNYVMIRHFFPYCIKWLTGSRKYGDYYVTFIVVFLHLSLPFLWYYRHRSYHTYGSTIEFSPFPQ